MVDLLGVSRSGYYAWAARRRAGPGLRVARRAELTVKIKAAHEASDGVNGATRITADLRESGEVVSVKTIAKLMRAGGLRGISPRPWHPVTTAASAASAAGQRAHTIPDLVQRRFDQGRLNLVWTSDITYLDTGQGWLYLCAVRDGCSRRVIGYAFSDSLHTDVVETAVRRAVQFRDGDTDGVIFHADRGCQYLPVHLHPAGRRRRPDRRPVVRRTDRGVLRQRPAGELLVDPEDRVLRPAHLRHPRPRRHVMDREHLQPPPPALRPRHHQPGSVRTPTHRGTGRIADVHQTGSTPIANRTRWWISGVSEPRFSPRCMPAADRRSGRTIRCLRVRGRW